MAARDLRLTVATVSKALLWLVYAWVVVNIVLLFLAFILRLLGANPQAGFSEWVYDSVARSMAPFRGLFEPIVLTDDSVLDTSLLFAMIVYAIVALFLSAAIDWVSRRLSDRRWQLASEAAPAPMGSYGDTPTVAPPPAYPQTQPPHRQGPQPR